MPFNLVVNGVENVQGKLNLLAETVRTDATRAAVRAGANVIKEEMVLRAPVLDRKTAQSNALEPGSLRNGIGVSMKKVVDSSVTALVGANKTVSHVARFVEYGHVLVRGGTRRLIGKRVRGSGKIIGHVPAHPFLRPAFDSKAAACLEAMQAELAEQVRKVVG